MSPTGVCLMNRFTPSFFLLIFPSFFAASTWVQTSAARVEETVARSSEKTPAIAPVPQHLFGTIALSTRSEEARGALELAIDKYENAMYDDAVVHARHATEKDLRSALSYAMLLSLPDAPFPIPRRWRKQSPYSPNPPLTNNSWSVG
jgi:hypothetical protein